MFHSSVYALAWSVFKKRQWEIVALISFIPFLILIKFLLSQYVSPEIIHNKEKLQSLLLVMVMPLILLVFTLSDSSTSQFQKGFPSYTFTHPVSAMKLALVPLTTGIIFISIFFIAWLVLIEGKAVLYYQCGILFLLVSGSLSWIQVVSWRLNHAPYISTMVSLALIGIDFVLLVSTWNTASLTPLIPKSMAIVALFALPISGTWLAIDSVAAARTHRTGAKRWRLSNVGFVGFRLPQYYRSSSQALFRYEWRVFGWILPMAGTFIVAALVYTLFKAEYSFQILPLISLVTFSLILIPWFLPLEIAKSDLAGSSGKPKSLSSFLLSLPISNYSIAMAKLKLASRSIIIYQTMILLAINVILFSLQTELCKNRINGEIKPCFVNPWEWLNQNFNALDSVLIIICANTMIPLIAWSLCGNFLSWCLKGDKFFTVRMTIISTIGLVLILTFALRMYSTEAFRAQLWSYAPFINALAFICILLFFTRATMKYKAAFSINFPHRMIIGALSLVVLCFYSIYFTGLVSVGNPHPLIILLDLSMLAILPIFTAAFSVARNRAR